MIGYGSIREGTRDRPSKWSLLPASPPYLHPCPLESGLKTAIRSCHSQLETLRRPPFQSKSQSLQWLIWTYHHPDFLSCWALPPTHTTQSQGPLPFCLSLKLLLPEAFSLVALGLERWLPLPTWVKSLTSFRTWCKWNLLRKAYPEHPTPQWALTCPSHPLTLYHFWSPYSGLVFHSTCV